MNVLGILLAAGFSRRFGDADKLLHPLPDGHPLALAAARNLLQAVPDVLAVVREENKTIKDELERAGVQVLTCSSHQREMADSLAAAIRLAAHQYPNSAGYVVALGDMPYIHSATIAAIASRIAAGSAIAAPVYQGRRGHPVGFSARFRDELLELKGDHGARPVLERHRDEIELLECDDPGILVDIDTPADLR